MTDTAVGLIVTGAVIVACIGAIALRMWIGHQRWMARHYTRGSGNPSPEIAHEFHCRLLHGDTFCSCAANNSAAGHLEER